MSDPAAPPETPPPPPPPTSPATADDGTTLRIAVVVFVVGVTLYLIALLGDYYGLAFFAGKLSLGLFLAGSIWCVGFLLLRTANQAATESYDLEHERMLAQHWDDDSDGPDSLHARALQHYDELARRHEEIARTRAYSAAFSLYGTASAAVAAATVLVGIGGFWALLDFLAIVFLLGALIAYGLGSGHRDVTRHLDRFLPPRWQRNES